MPKPKLLKLLFSTRPRLGSPHPRRYVLPNLSSTINYITMVIDLLRGIQADNVDLEEMLEQLYNARQVMDGKKHPDTVPTDGFAADAAAAAEIHSLIDAARAGRISLDQRSELKMVDIDHSARMLIMSGV